MTEWDLLEWFINQRKSGSNIYYNTKEVHKGIKDDGCQNKTRRKILSLFYSGFLERELSGTFRDWHMRFRVKDKYVNTSIGNSI